MLVLKVGGCSTKTEVGGSDYLCMDMLADVQFLSVIHTKEKQKKKDCCCDTVLSCHRWRKIIAKGIG